MRRTQDTQDTQDKSPRQKCPELAGTNPRTKDTTPPLGGGVPVLDVPWRQQRSNRMTNCRLRRLIDIGGVRDAESRIVLDKSLAARSAGWDGTFDALSVELFGVTAEQVDQREYAFEGDEMATWCRECFEPDAVSLFRRHGWDVTDDYGHELMVLTHLKDQFLAAIHGKAGAHLPGVGTDPESWGRRLQQEASERRRTGRR